MTARAARRYHQRLMKRAMSMMLVLLAACGTKSPAPSPAPASGPASTPAATLVPGQSQTLTPSSAIAWPSKRLPCPAPHATPSPWRHRRSAVAATAGDARHVAADVIVAAGTPSRLDGKFAYGSISKDLEDELVQAFVASEPCKVVTVGAPVLTNDDGRASVEMAALPAGHHLAWLVVAADSSWAEAGVWSLPPATPAVLFDVDGTLTVDDGELFEDLLGGKTAEAFDGAARVARTWAEKGYLIIYVTGRPYPLRDHTRRWLEANQFPYGPLFTPDRMRSAVPTTAGVGEFKRQLLVELQTRNVTFARAYGNAATDVCAYAQARISPSSTWIVGKRPACDGFAAPNPLASYVDHLADVERQPAAH